MFRHPIRDLIMLSAIGWYAKRHIDKQGGVSKMWASLRRASPARAKVRAR